MNTIANFKKIRVVILIILSAVPVVLSVAIYLNFHPVRAYELPGSFRIFAEGIDSSDETIHVKASDWPHTFWKPFFLGDAAWPERYIESQFMRSKDGTVVAFLAHERGSSRSVYVSAYDFKNHKKMGGHHSNKNNDDHDEISFLLDERGSVFESPIEIPSLNSGDYDK